MSVVDTKIQVISRSDFTDQHLISIPPLSTPLAPSSVRVRSSLLSLIVNTLTCASHPELKIGWWDVHPLPPSTPSPFNDPNKYGRIGVWGWATVLESTLNNVPLGASLYGFFPVATLPLDLQLTRTDAPGIYRETSPFRAEALRIYNTYEVHTAGAPGDEASQALDALAKPTFRLAYLFATSKSALGLSYMLARPNQPTKPRRVVALTSSASASFAKATGWYSDVVTYDEAERVAQLETRGRKVVIVDFGGRGESAQRAYRAVQKEGAATVQLMAVGGENKKDSMKFTPEAVASAIQQGIILVDTGLMVDSAEKTLGEDGEAKLNKEYDETWGEFKEAGFPGMRVIWGDGVEEYAKTYEKMCNGEVKADVSYVFRM